MTISFFNNCNTLEEAKKMFYKLAKQFHPDKGGDVETMKKINNEYDFVTAKLAKGEQFKEEEQGEQFEMAQEYRDKIFSLINVPGIIIEICGLWIWITGDTRTVKEELKELGFFWAKKKLAWYWRPESAKVNNRSPYSLDEIRQKYNSNVITEKGKFIPA